MITNLTSISNQRWKLQSPSFYLTFLCLSSVKVNPFSVNCISRKSGNCFNYQVCRKSTLTLTCSSRSEILLESSYNNKYHQRDQFTVRIGMFPPKKGFPTAALGRRRSSRLKAVRSKNIDDNDEVSSTASTPVVEPTKKRKWNNTNNNTIKKESSSFSPKRKQTKSISSQSSQSPSPSPSPSSPSSSPSKNPLSKAITTPKRKSTPKKKSSTPSSPTNTPKRIIFSSDIAEISPENPWIDLKVPPEEFRPSSTLTTGQCFNFIVVHNDQVNEEGLENTKKSAWGTHNETEWIGPIQNLVLSIKETESTTLYRILHHNYSDDKEEVDTTKFLQRYFQLEVPLKPLYEQWSKNDPRLAKIAPCIPGLRIIRQDPIECMFSFICSSNNNIPRITKMLSSLRTTYGKKLIDIPTRRIVEDDKSSIDDDEATSSSESIAIYSFPTLEQLKPATESSLREMGLGYRAKYIIETRDLLITNGGRDHLLSLRDINDTEKVQEELLQYTGVGRKVADCIGLFSLDQIDAIPVDVHVQHIASRDYDPSVLGEAKSLTPRIYKRVGDLFRDRFTYAGWAHSLLFVAELPSFRDVLPVQIVEEMDLWKEQKAAEKKEKK